MQRLRAGKPCANSHSPCHAFNHATSNHVMHASLLCSFSLLSFLLSREKTKQKQEKKIAPAQSGVLLCSIVGNILPSFSSILSLSFSLSHPSHPIPPSLPSYHCISFPSNLHPHATHAALDLHPSPPPPSPSALESFTLDSGRCRHRILFLPASFCNQPLPLFSWESHASSSSSVPAQRIQPIHARTADHSLPSSFLLIHLGPSLRFC